MKMKNTVTNKTLDATSPEVRDAILAAMARKALHGNVAAAKVVLEAQNSVLPVDAINKNILAIADLINHPLPDIDIEDIRLTADDDKTTL